MSTPDKTNPLEAEAQDQPIEVTFKDVVWILPPKGKWRLSTITAFEANEISKGFESVLGSDQWNRLLEVDPTADEIQEFIDSILGAVGGNS